jgi:transposase-like protein
MALSAAQWDAIRTEYQAGAFVRALARHHGVHESSIRQKAREQNWTRDPQAAERIRRANQPSGLHGMATSYAPHRPAPRHSTNSRSASLAPGTVPE